MSRRLPQSAQPASVASDEDGRQPSSWRYASQRGSSWLTFGVSTLVVARYFLPAESAALGDTLWIVQFWLMAGVIWFWLTARSRHRLRRLDGLDWAIGLLVGGHVLSAIVVLLTEGDRRAALNMLWEWVGIGVSALLIRETVSQNPGRSQLMSVLVISAVTLSGLGLWQHYVWYPQVSRLLTEFEVLSHEMPTGPQEAAEREARLRALHLELGSLTVVDDPAATELLRARILASTEPIGRFALANTLAGLLLAGLFVGIGGLLLARNRESVDWRVWPGFVLMLAVGYCFCLTKSRTAWMGLLAGFLIWGGLTRHNQRTGTGLLRVGALLGLVLAGLAIVASLLGGLDRQVLTEAPKSLEYRWGYWSATASVIRDAPWVGVGPGNFRQAYLRHKLPGSSEEILDPHNLFLDIWANGGLMGCAGLLTLLLAMGKALWRINQPQGEHDVFVEPENHGATMTWRLLVGGLAVGMAAFAELFNGVGVSDHNWTLLLGWCGVCLLWPRTTWSGKGAPLFLAAVAALTVHLMGAGGIAMPAILQTLVILAACAVCVAGSPRRANTTDRVERDVVPWPALSGAAVCLCLAVACAVTATLPVSEARTQTQVGRALMTRATGSTAARNAFRNAIEADPLVAAPWQELALAMMADWSRQAGTDDETFASAVFAQKEAIERNPHSAHSWQILGRMWWRRYEVTQDRSAAEEAFGAFQTAVEHYPTLPTLQVEFGQSAAAAGQLAVAQNAAASALRLDAINRQQGHVDKYLPQAAREWAEAHVSQGL